MDIYPVIGHFLELIGSETDDNGQQNKDVHEEYEVKSILEHKK